MAKGDDALRRKRNKVIRKRLRVSKSSVSARVAAIIAAKHRRKAGKRRICQGMCYSLPTEDDPFNERFEKKAIVKKKGSKKRNFGRRGNNMIKNSDLDLDRDKRFEEKFDRVPNAKEKFLKKPSGNSEINTIVGSFENVGVSKFLVLCLKAIENAWVEEGTFDKSVDGTLLINPWGVEFCKACSVGSTVVVTSETFATRNEVAWLVSTAADIVVRKEKQGVVVASPFLLFLVSSEDRAVEVRSFCKPLKALGVHTISLHPGTSLDHQIFGLKNCQPEFLVSTPERLLELVSLNAVDISGTSLLVLDGLTKFGELRLLNSVKSIRESIFGDLQIISFSKSYGKVSVTMLLQLLVRGSVYRLSAEESVTGLSSFVSQYIHFCTSEEEKFSEVIQILAETLGNQTVGGPDVLLISGSASQIDQLVAYLNSKGYAIGDDSHTCVLHDREKSGTILVKDVHNIHDLDLHKFEVAILIDFPSTAEDYIAILTKIARHTLAGALHSFFSRADASLARSLIDVLEQCGQKVPKFLRSFQSSNRTAARQRASFKPGTKMGRVNTIGVQS